VPPYGAAERAEAVPVSERSRFGLRSRRLHSGGALVDRGETLASLSVYWPDSAIIAAKGDVMGKLDQASALFDASQRRDPTSDRGPGASMERAGARAQSD
jgi:hypothetical protein